ncbi:MAG: tryptophan halogenase family protein, partial [Blastocatellia bacterium]
GGGSAGWMTAAFLSKAMPEGVDIELVESRTISSIGVGEATFSDIHLFFEFLGLPEDEWMPECNASYKVAIRFVNWNAERRDFYHPFQRFELVQGRRIIEWWLKLNRDARFDRACFTVPAICDAQRSPRYLDGRAFDSRIDGQLGPSKAGEKAVLIEDLHVQYPYAYHFDASLLAKFLSGFAKRRGVSHVLDDVTKVNQSEDGFIKSITTKEHGDIAGDLFIDCTGFRGLLINEVLNEPFMSFSESLPCDRAVAMQVPSDREKEGINPYTTATALSAGWVWNIPLYHRVGTGYVYCSAFLSPEEAEREFREHLGRRSEGCRASHIKMRVGRNRNSWVKNCVAIGLSSGFVEPLESTGIFFIHHAVEQLVSYFPRKRFEEESIKSYNKIIGNCIDGVREFLTVHYVASTRRDTEFWRATQTELIIPDELRERLRLWKHRLPTDRTIKSDYHGFPAYSYCVILLGMGYRPEHCLPLLDYGDDTLASAAFDRIRAKTEQLTASLPCLFDYLKVKYGESDSRISSVAS